MNLFVRRSSPEVCQVLPVVKAVKCERDYSLTGPWEFCFHLSPQIKDLQVTEWVVVRLCMTRKNFALCGLPSTNFKGTLAA